MSILKFKNNIGIINTSTVVGKLEKNGPLGDLFDISNDDCKFGQNTWESAESESISMAITTILKKSGIEPKDIEVAFGGDLINQCTSSSNAIKEFGIPYCGLYGACSTFALSLGLASLYIDSLPNNDSMKNKKTLTLTSSNFCSAERQFRFPIEYGSQRTPTSQNTVSGAACTLLSKSDTMPRITEFMPGIINDYKIKDANNMGAAMAPAFADSIYRYFNESKCKISDFDLILSGDLGKEGMQIATELLYDKGLDISNIYNDCGCMIYDFDKQDVHSGGSGPACSACVVCSEIYNKLKTSKLKNVLFVGTGALLNSSTVLQKQTIPGIAHLVRITSNELY